MIRDFRWTPGNAEQIPEYTGQLLEALANPLYVHVWISWLHLDMSFDIAYPDDPKLQVSFLDEPYTLGMHARLLSMRKCGYRCQERTLPLHTAGRPDRVSLFLWPSGQTYSIIHQEEKCVPVRSGLTLPAAYDQLSKVTREFAWERSGSASRSGCGSSFGGPNFVGLSKDDNDRAFFYIWPDGLPVKPMATRQPVQLSLL